MRHPCQIAAMSSNNESDVVPDSPTSAPAVASSHVTASLVLDRGTVIVPSWGARRAGDTKERRPFVLLSQVTATRPGIACYGTSVDEGSPLGFVPADTFPVEKSGYSGLSVTTHFMPAYVLPCFAMGATVLGRMKGADCLEIRRALRELCGLEALPFYPSKRMANSKRGSIVELSKALYRDVGAYTAVIVTNSSTSAYSNWQLMVPLLARQPQNCDPDSDVRASTEFAARLGKAAHLGVWSASRLFTAQPGDSWRLLDSVITDSEMNALDTALSDLLS